MSRMLITGGAGFVASHLIDASLKAGHQVHVVVRPGSSDERLRRFGQSLFRHRFDLRAEAELRSCIADVTPDVLFHLAASPRRPEKPHLADARENVREDLDCLIALLAAAADARRPPNSVIRTGSLAEYGSAPLPHREEVREAPTNVYAAGLVAAAHFVGALQSRLPFPVATARLALVYGPSQSNEYFLPCLITRCLAGKHSTVQRPEDRRDLVFVEDAVTALLRISAAPLSAGTVVNIASGIAPTMREVARSVIELTHARPDLVEYDNSNPPSEAAKFCPSPEQAGRLFGWHARTSLRDGLKRTVSWYRNRVNRGEDEPGHEVHPEDQTLRVA